MNPVSTPSGTGPGLAVSSLGCTNHTHPLPIPWEGPSSKKGLGEKAPEAIRLLDLCYITEQVFEQSLIWAKHAGRSFSDQLQK